MEATGADAGRATEPTTPTLSLQSQVEGLRLENERLRQQVSVLEAGLEEHRRQMAGVLTSASWRVTSPLRMIAGRLRRLRGWPRRRRSRRVQVRQVPTAGLFPPAPGVSHGHDVAARLIADPALLRSPRPVPPAVRSTGVLVVAHVYYPEVWSDIADRLVRIPEPFDLVVTLVEGRADWIEAEIRARYPQARVLLVPNLGRDMAPLVRLANEGHLDGYEAILKVHTKRSPHRLDGDAWRVRLLDGVLPSPLQVEHLLALLRSDPDVGVVAPPGSLSGPEHWGSNLPVVEALASRVPLAFDPEALVFAAGSMFWCRAWVLQRLADLDLVPEHFEDEAGHTDGTTAHGLERYVGIVAQASGLDIITDDDVSARLHRRAPVSHRPQVLATYLPQYHPIPENDAWWGEGFTDWDNVDKAGPHFAGHVQPHRPGEFGRYDLRDPAVMAAQGALARAHGIDGFLVYHYWLGPGRRLLRTPIDQLLADPVADFPFALCWANESWTRAWDGLDQEVLAAQEYPLGWEQQFFEGLGSALIDPRYVRIDGRPLLAVYRPAALPDPAGSLRRLRALAVEAGLPGLHLVGMEPPPEAPPLTGAARSALDAVLSFPPASGLGLHSLVVGDLTTGAAGGDVLSYDAAVEGSRWLQEDRHGPRVHPGVMPGWDNTPRRGADAYVFHGSNPAGFRRWMRRAVLAAGRRPDGLVLVNSWNEWAEGAHLEPDVRFGRAWLEAVRDCAGSTPLARAARPSRG